MSNANEPAYPTEPTHWHEQASRHMGLTKREAFAMAALPALIAAEKKDWRITRLDICAEAFNYADAMLAAGELTKEP